MLIDDIRLGRLIRSYATAFNTTGAVNTTFPANRQRVAITVNVVPTNTNPFDLLITFTNGSTILVTSGAFNPGHLRIQDYGDLVTMGFTLTGPVTNFAGNVTEYTLPEWVTASNLEQYRSHY